MKSDIEIAQAASPLPITKIAQELGLSTHEIEPYGNDKAKLTYQAINRIKKQHAGKLVLVTAINPTPAGEGKSTVTIGLGDALKQRHHRVSIALREPSLGPVMGLKGGAAGGGYAQVIPMESINLHFTGDIHALTSAHNTLTALIDNHMHQGNTLQIDPKRITWPRVLDINDRTLRQITIAQGPHGNGVMREGQFDITVASELMAILCLSKDLSELKSRIAKIVIGYTVAKKPVYVRDLGVQGAIAALLKDAIKPNLVQTLEGTPAFIHGGPFANIAHGANSILATEMAMKTSDITITEAGFGADLGAEKFLDIVTPNLPNPPSAIVLVATVRALKYNGGQALSDLNQENLATLTAGTANLIQHLHNLKSYGIPVVVAINRFASDTESELSRLKDLVAAEDTACATTEVFAKGGQGGLELAEKVEAALEQTAHYRSKFEKNSTLTEKLTTLAHEIYHADNIELSAKAKQQLSLLTELGCQNLPVCVAKTQYSFSDDPKQLGAPRNFTLHIREFIPKNGAGFVVALAGSVLTMPGLPKEPAALQIDVDANGKISGLF